MKRETKTAAVAAPVALAAAPAKSTPANHGPRLTALDIPETEEAKLRTALAEAVRKMSPCRLQELARFVQIMENDHGCSTPAENLITTLVLKHCLRGLTPESVEEELAEFRTDFNDAVRAAKQFNSQYPKLVQQVA